MAIKLSLNPLDNIANMFMYETKFLMLENQSKNRCDGVVVRVSDSQSVDLRFILHVESYQKILKNGM